MMHSPRCCSSQVKRILNNRFRANSDGDMNSTLRQHDLNVRQRWISFAEFAIGAAIVIAHNVYRRIPNEVPILFVLGWISIRFRDGGWKTVGLNKPDSWRKTILWGLLAGILIIAAGQFADFVGAKIWHQAAKGSSVIEEAKTTWRAALLRLVLVWTFAAFGEEMVYRGYLLTRAADVGNRSRLAYWMALLASSVLFGYGHYYKGPPGILQSIASGLILGGAYLLFKRNLWVSVIAHGFADTIAIAAILLGLAD
jgi:membrane protease YdiL (CAAX protease family)